MDNVSGIRVSPNTDIANLENIEQKFNQRYKVKASKTVKVAKKSYFGGGLGGGKPSGSF